MEQLLGHQLNRKQVRQYLSKSFKTSTNILYQIKNTIQIGYGLAKSKEKKLIYKYLRMALILNQDFKSNFKGAKLVENLNSYI